MGTASCRKALRKNWAWYIFGIGSWHGCCKPGVPKT